MFVIWRRVGGQRKKTSHVGVDPNDSTNASAKDFNTQDVNLQDLSVNHVVEDGKDIYLVDWSGPDDPEVSTPLGSMRLTFLTQSSESPELAQQLEVAGWFSNLPP